MIRHGQAPYLECSSKGDRRFSAFYASLYWNSKKDSIENHYQAAKLFDDGTTGLDWRKAKGRKAVNQAEVVKLYGLLWDKYIAEHPELWDVLIHATGVSDIFGQKGHVCQATELWRIRGEIIAWKATLNQGK